MKLKIIILSIILSMGLFTPSIFAEPTVNIVMEKTTYSYCERLFYIIEVSEVTGDPAIIHIRDESGKGSSAIPIQISNLQNPVPSLVAFEKDIFPLGKYFVNVEYSGSEFTAEFDLIDSNNICIPEFIKQMMGNWLSGNISDGFMMDAFQKYVDKQLINIPFEINEDNVYNIEIPKWVKNTGYWWIEGVISDDELAQIVNYLIEKNIITYQVQMENEI